jgi:hypothetical protein
MEADRFDSGAPLEIADFVITTDFDSLAIVNEANVTENFHAPQTSSFTY